MKVEILIDGQNIRPEVLQFASFMERVLRDNEDKGGWVVATNKYLFEKLKEEVKELKEELKVTSEFHSFEIGKECTDIANYCMMMWINNQAKER